MLRIQIGEDFVMTNEKKKYSTNCRKKSSSVAKLGLHVSSQDSKYQLVKHIESALERGVKVGCHVIVGFNSVNKLLDKCVTVRKSNEIRRTESSTIKNHNQMPNDDKIAEIAQNQRKQCVSVICVCKDSPTVLQNRVVEAAVLQGLPVAIIPHFANQLASLFKIKRASCFAIIPPYSEEAHVPNTYVHSNENMTSTIDDACSEEHPAALDELREHLLMLASSH